MIKGNKGTGGGEQMGERKQSISVSERGIRALALAACGYVCALLTAHYLLPEALLFYLAAACAAVSPAALLLKGRARRVGLLLLLSAALGFGWYGAYRALFVNPAEQFAGQARTVTLRITEYPVVYDDYSAVTARSVDETLPHVRLLIYDNAAGMEELEPGDVVEMPLKLVSAARRYREDSDYYLAEGILLRGYLRGDYTAVRRSAGAWLCFPKRIARAIKTAALETFPSDVAPLMKALLTGDRKEYYEDDVLSSAMKTAGFVHIISVSGMHVAFLVGALSLLTGRRRLTALMGIPMVTVFVAMMGFTPSVVRAGVMQCLLLIAPLLRRENDPPTSLAAAGLILLLANPIAVGGVSLQLSFAAMAGLILLSPRIFDWLTRNAKGRSRLPKGLFGAILRSLCSAFSASVGALVFTVPLSALHFGSVAIYAVATNLLCLWAMSAAFLLGYPTCLVRLLWQPLGTVIGWVVAWLPRYAAAVVKRIAALPGAMLYTKDNLGAWWLIFVYLLFGVTYALKGKKPYRPVLPVCAAVISLLALSAFTELRISTEPRFTAVDVGQGQCLAALTQRGTVMIDCGGSCESPGDAAADYLLSCGRRSVDLLVLTHFHADHANGVKRLMSRVKVSRVAFPTDCEENEYMREILALCEAQGTEVFGISQNTDMRVDDLTLRLYAPLGSEDINEHCLLIRGDYGEFEFLVTGDAGIGVEKLLTGFYDLGDLELLVVGHHGSRYATGETLLDSITPEYAFISVGTNNGYGHPTEDVLERLAERNIAVRRTDLEGTISMTVGSSYG